jgi:hypothetical protein
MKLPLRTYRAHCTALLATILLSASFSNALAADEKKEEPKKKKWESTATVGVTLSRGNSKNFLAAGALATKRTWTCDEALAGIGLGYGENTPKGSATNNITDSYVKGYGQWNHLFSPQFYGGLRLTGEHDDIAHLTYRAIVSPLAGYYFVKQTNATLAAEIGPSYVREDYYNSLREDGSTDDNVHNYLGLRVGERGEYIFHSGAKIFETIEWIPKIQDMNDYLVNFTAGVSAPISKGFSVSLALTDTYKNIPPITNPKTYKNDLKLIAGLTYNF